MLKSWFYFASFFPPSSFPEILFLLWLMGRIGLGDGLEGMNLKVLKFNHKTLTQSFLKVY